MAEKMTAREAANAGLIEAINNGETTLECNVVLARGKLNFEQKEFSFKDKEGKNRKAEFKDDSELIAFYSVYYPED